MIIDWITVAAQAANFLILVWVMKRFLFKPILNAVEDREKRIATELSNADKMKADAQKEQEEFKHKNEEFDAQRAALWSKATDEAQAERQKLFDAARKDAAILSAKQQETMRNEIHKLNQAIMSRTQQEVFAITRKALADLAGMSLEERMVDVFIGKLHDLNGTEKKLLVSSLKASDALVIVRTTFDLPPAQRNFIEGAIKSILGLKPDVRFETVPEMIGGIELSANGHKVAWSIADYLASLEKGVDELLKEKDKSDGETKTKAKHKPKVPKTATRSQ